jgi:hypothetical protein
MKHARKAPGDTQRDGASAEHAPVRAGTSGGTTIIQAIDRSPRQGAQRQQATAIERSPRGVAQRKAIEALGCPSAGAVVQRQIGKSKDGEEVYRRVDNKVFRALLLSGPSASGTHFYRLMAADETVDNVSEADPAYDSLNGEPYYATPTADHPVAVPLPAVLYHATSGRLGGSMPGARSWFTPNFEDAVDYSNQTANVSLIYRYTVTQRLVSGLLLMQQQAQFASPADTLLAEQGLTAGAHGWLENRPGVQSVFLKNPSAYLAFSGVCGYIQPSIFSVPMGTPVRNSWTDWHGSIDTLRTGTNTAFPANARAGHLGRYDRTLADAI